MDLFMLVWVLLWGLIPPVATGYWAYKQGLKGRNEAMALRDEALAHVKALHDELGGLEKRLLDKIPEPVVIPKIPTADEIVKLMDKKLPDFESIKTDLKDSLTRSLDGYMGATKKEMMKEFDAKAQDYVANNTEQRTDGAMDKIMTRLLERFL